MGSARLQLHSLLLPDAVATASSQMEFSTPNLKLGEPSLLRAASIAHKKGVIAFGLHTL
jgi:hypothetical protein